MINPRKLIQSGDFIVGEEYGDKTIYMVVQKGTEIILVSLLYDTWWYLNEYYGKIKKIYRFNEGQYDLYEDESTVFSKKRGKIIYNSEWYDVKKMTIEDLEEHFECKVKIVKENENGY